MTEQSSSRRSGGRRLAPTLVGVGLMVGCVTFIVKVLVDDWAQVSRQVSNADPRWLAAALVGAVAGMIWIAYCWADALEAVGGSMPRLRSVAWYFVGEIAKYLPGSIWAAVGRGEIARRRGVPVAAAYPSVVLSLVALYLAAALTAAALVPFDLAHSAEIGPALLLLLLVPAGLGSLHPRVLGVVFGTVERLTKRSLNLPVPAWKDTVLLVVRYVPAWLAIAASTWCVARALPGVDAPFLRVAIATVLSWTAGFVTPTPGGAGVREAVFVAASGLASVPAIAVAVTARLAFVLVDVGGALIGLPFSRISATAGGPVDSITPAGSSTALDEEG